MVVQAGDSGLTDGFHAYEPTDPLRWTAGDAMLPAALFALRGSGPIEMVLTLGGATRYLEQGVVAAA